MNMVPATPTMEEVQISCLESPRVALTSVRRGAMANQMKNAMKKPHQE